MHTLTILIGIRADIGGIIRTNNSDVLITDLCREAAVKIDMAIAIEKAKMYREIQGAEQCYKTIKK